MTRADIKRQTSAVKNRLALGPLLLALFYSGALLFAPYSAVDAQQSRKVSRIGYLSGSGSSPTNAFVQGLRDLGYTEGKDVLFDFHTAQGKIDRLAQLASTLVGSVHIILAADFNSALAAKQATGTIPIVFQTLGDPVASGLVSSLAHPGKNLTGVAGFGPELSGKRLELIKEVVPGLSQVAFLTDPSNVAGAATLRETEAAAKSLGVRLQVYKVRDTDELKNAFTSMKRKQPDALMINHDPTLTAQRKHVLSLAEQSRLPTIYVETQWAPSGGLMSYGPSLSDQFLRAAMYVDKILKGAKPGDLPVEQPSKFELAINLKTAKQIGVPIPQKVLARADRVIK